jgi:hypothetical protein
MIFSLLLFEQSLVLPSKPIVQQSTVEVVGISVGEGSGVVKTVSKRKDAEPSTTGQSANMIASPRAEHSETEAEPVLKILGAYSTADVAASSNKRPTVTDNSRAPKKLKESGSRDAYSGPSLLSRMGSAVTDADLTHEHSNGLRDLGFSNQLPEDGKVSAGGYSIRGAARAGRRSEASPGPTMSLLDRIKELSTGENDVAKKRRRRGGRSHR